MTRGDERTRAITARLNDHRGDRKAADDAVAVVVMCALRLGARRVFADDCAGEHNVPHQAAVLGRIAHVRPTGQHGNRQAARAQRAAVRGPVVAKRHTADRDKTRAAERRADGLCGLQAVGRRLARTDDGNAGLHVKIRPTAAHIQRQRRVGDRAQTAGIAVVPGRNQADVLFRAVRNDALGFAGILVAECIHLRLGQAARRTGQRFAVSGKHRLRRAECFQQLRCNARPDMRPPGQPYITQMG